MPTDVPLPNPVKIEPATSSDEDEVHDDGGKKQKKSRDQQSNPKNKHYIFDAGEPEHDPEMQDTERDEAHGAIIIGRKKI